ncbi:hypothetical protein CPY53_06300 [Paenibacillus polymyxa]|nr:hypothetical protein BJH92_15080 [Paenibacillus polymyxa]UNL93205.1 hypothetical protein CPY53_06300 [Paenibacillus polymyxa]
MSIPEKFIKRYPAYEDAVLEILNMIGSIFYRFARSIFNFYSQSRTSGCIMFLSRKFMRAM